MMTTRRRFTVIFGAATACVWLAGCAGLTPLSEVLDDDESSQQTTPTTATPTPVATHGGTDGGGSGDDEDRETVIYIWSLPPDPETPTFNDDSAYEALFRGDCDSASGLTSTETSSPNYGAWTSPRAVVFTAAGVAYCRGDAETGAALARQAVVDYGTEGLGPADMPWCKLYRALQSVREQRPPDAFECRGIWPDGPDFRTGVDANGWTLWDDPLTAADESIPPSPPESPSQPDPSRSPNETPRPDESLPGASDE